MNLEPEKELKREGQNKRYEQKNLKNKKQKQQQNNNKLIYLSNTELQLT